MSKNRVHVIRKSRELSYVAAQRFILQLKSLYGYLVPPGEQFSIWTFEKSTHICSTKWDTCHWQWEAHGYSGLEMTPFCWIVPCPHCSITLWACIMRPCQDKRSKFAFWPLQHAFIRRHCLKKHKMYSLPFCSTSQASSLSSHNSKIILNHNARREISEVTCIIS